MVIFMCLIIMAFSLWYFILVYNTIPLYLFYFLFVVYVVLTLYIIFCLQYGNPFVSPMSVITGCPIAMYYIIK